MSLALTEDHRAFADLASTVLADLAGSAGARRALLESEPKPRWWSDEPVWQEMSSSGWLGIHIDEQFGGQGYGLPELAVVLEQLGRTAMAGPFLPTVITAAVIAATGSDQQRDRWLPKLVSGQLVAAVGMKSSAVQAHSCVFASRVAALGESSSDVFLIPVDEDVVLLETGPAVTARAAESEDMLTRAITTLELTSAPITDTLPGAASVLTRIVRLLAAAEAVGGLAACTESATEYAASREQFGRPIGSFQAVKHHCANMLVDAELATAATWDAARAAGAEADLAVTMSAGYALPAYQRAALRNIQIHGGIGYTWEHDAHLFLRRATVLLLFAGGAEALQDDVINMQRAGIRRNRTVDLPPEAEDYRRAAEEFRRKLEGVNPDQAQTTWARTGYLQPHWPKPYGRGANSVEQLVVEQVLDGVDKPSLGLGEWVVPTLLQHGSPEQIDRLIWPSLEGRLRWCQLFSEPGAGSDAAAVATKAQRAEGGWLVTGQKVWTSDAMNCQRGLATVRTDPAAAKHKGITMMIIDLTKAGVEVRPLKEITGETLFNEVFLTDVFVPDHDVVGAVNAGWRVAMATFGNERVSIGGGSVTMTADKLIELLDRHRARDVGFAREAGKLLIEAYCMAALNLRQAARAVFEAGPGIEGNVAKLFGAEHAQRVAELALAIAGSAALVGEEAAVIHDYLFSRCLTIAGGTSEIVRNLVAERILGLPRDPTA
ncbi:acyl-CoA dehydrogenase [Mycobacterium sp. E2497]|uniref:acyl-CoA dehydrogenase n=1 Tax=Mycobacterium sp. E2497 TaxID=1834135 RepID=UPI0007FC6492|nr:acyl-CoA dehydrogenase [Mycobacterium sp. E2497]OBI17582.1 acyl-CoA dehydrogenase [Mycobacterium sp. E2497]